MARDNSASRRLAKAFKMTAPDTAIAIVAVDGEKTRHIIKWEDMKDDRIVGLAYRNIFRLTSDPGDALLARVFAAAKLNPNDPTHWRVLLEFFVWAHYGDRRKRGRPKEWDSARLSQLREDYRDVKSRNPFLSDDYVFRILGRRAAYQTKQGPLSDESVRKITQIGERPKTQRTIGDIQKDCTGPEFHVEEAQVKSASGWRPNAGESAPSFASTPFIMFISNAICAALSTIRISRVNRWICINSLAYARR